VEANEWFAKHKKTEAPVRRDAPQLNFCFLQKERGGASRRHSLFEFWFVLVCYKTINSLIRN
ncbi:MAG: hypothetical protein ACK5Y4_17440, partial [Pseudanabaena sp.]